MLSIFHTEKLSPSACLCWIIDSGLSRLDANISLFRRMDWPMRCLKYLLNNLPETFLKIMQNVKQNGMRGLAAVMQTIAGPIGVFEHLPRPLRPVVALTVELVLHKQPLLSNNLSFSGRGSRPPRTGYLPSFLLSLFSLRVSLDSRLSSLPQSKSAVIWRVFNFSLNDHKKKSNMYIYIHIYINI